MNKSSINNIKIDFKKSKDSFIYDQRTKKPYLDFMGMYSTLAIGYNNTELKKKFLEYPDILDIITNKITNCEIGSEILEKFTNNFKSVFSQSIFHNFYYTSSGALAVEAAIKTALFGKRNKSLIMTFKGSFHGIYGYGGILTDRFDSIKKRLEFFPGDYWEKLTPYYSKESHGLNNNNIEFHFKKVDDFIKKNEDKIAAILVEPVQCTYGDHYLHREFIKYLKFKAIENDIPLIFDEIQSGFYTTSKKWYFEHLDVKPDIIIFGKKAQLSGIMVNKKFSKIFDDGAILEATWDSNIIDMLRSNFIIEILNSKKNLLDDISDLSNFFTNRLLETGLFKNIRSCGYLIAIDFENSDLRNKFYNHIYSKGLIGNPTRKKTIRFRPNLLSTKENFDQALSIINSFK